MGSLTDGKICWLRIYIFKVQNLIENYNVIFKRKMAFREFSSLVFFFNAKKGFPPLTCKLVVLFDSPNWFLLQALILLSPRNINLSSKASLTRIPLKIIAHSSSSLWNCFALPTKVGILKKFQHRKFLTKRGRFIFTQ